MDAEKDPDVAGYDWIIVNSSAGKDSQAMLDVMAQKCREAGVPERLVVAHADLGRIEWPGTLELAREHAAHYGARFLVVRRKQVGDLLAEIRKRGKWPDSGNRYCTSYYKRDQIATLYTLLADELRRRHPGRRGPAMILNCLGFRAEESPKRRKLPRTALRERASSARKIVVDYLPIHDWPVARVWERIAAAGTRPHPAYGLGMTRLSCRFCIFAPRSQLIISARANPELFAEYVEAERAMGHTFRHHLSLVELDAAIKGGEQAGPDDGAWNM